MTKKWICFLLTFSLLLCASCSSAKSNLPGNVSWDMTQAQVTQVVGEQRITQGSSQRILNWLQTEELKDTYCGHTVSVAYIFISDALRSITVQILVNEGESMQDAKAATRTVMENTFGNATETDGAVQWQTDNVTVKMLDVEGAEGFFVVTYSPTN